MQIYIKYVIYQIYYIHTHIYIMNNQEKISNQPPDYMDINYADKYKRTTHTPLPRLLGISGTLSCILTFSFCTVLKASFSGLLTDL